MTEFLSPVGRMVQGDFFEPQTKDMQGAPRVIKTGPNAGQPNPQYYIGLAFAKNDPNWPAFEAIIKGEAAKGFPQFFPQGPLGPCTHPAFSMKIMDGDGIDQNGKSNATKEGFAGHWVVRFTTSFAPKVFPPNNYAPAAQLHDKNLAKRGYYYRVSGSVEANGQIQKPGVYINMNLVELIGYGPEIISGPDAATVFGGKPAALPAGASPTPLAHGAPGAAMAPPVQAVAPPSAGPIASPSSPPVQPYGGYMQVPGGVGAPVAPAAPPAAPQGPVMTPKAAGVPYAQFIAQGWTDATLRQHGYIM